VDKLKATFRLDEEEASLDQVSEFFARKFKKPAYNEFRNNPEDKPYQEILDASIFGHAV
jgi:hypothetical protein